jgi:hypothetical protein
MDPFARLAPRTSFFLLMRGEFRLAAEFDAAGFGASPTFARPRPDQFALEFTDPAQDRHQQAAVRRRRIGPGIGH